MNKKNYSNNLCLITALSLIVALPYANAFAADKARHKDRSHEVVMAGRQRYHYRDGRFYRPFWFGFELAIFRPSVGVSVRVLPAGHRTIVAGGVTYYYYDNVYYKAHPSGYIVVPEPAVRSNVVYVHPGAEHQALSGETVTINVRNANGSYTCVTLIIHNNGYIGPQGEYYTDHPTVAQLQALYGK